MRKLLLLPCLLVTLSALCQKEPALKSAKKTSESNKITKVLSQPIPPRNKSSNRINTTKKLTISRPTDHLLDLKNEPE